MCKMRKLERLKLFFFLFVFVSSSIPTVYRFQGTSGGIGRGEEERRGGEGRGEKRRWGQVLGSCDPFPCISVKEKNKNVYDVMILK